jgi:hypothetical protein
VYDGLVESFFFKLKGYEVQLIAMLTILAHPGLILVDNGHFQ